MLYLKHLTGEQRLAIDPLSVTDAGYENTTSFLFAALVAVADAYLESDRSVTRDSMLAGLNENLDMIDQEKQMTVKVISEDVKFAVHQMLANVENYEFDPKSGEASVLLECLLHWDGPDPATVLAHAKDGRPWVVVVGEGPQ